DPEGADEEARQAAAAAIRQFERLGDERGLARAWILWSDLDQHFCRWARYREANERALVHARRAHAEPEELDALTAIAHALDHDPTPTPDAIARCEEIRRESSMNRRREAAVVMRIGFLYGLQGKPDEARRCFTMSRETFDDLGLALWYGGWALHAGQAQLLAGEPAAAEQELRRGQRMLEQIGERSILSTLTAILSKAVYEQGRFEEAERLAASAFELGGPALPAPVASALRARAQGDVRRGQCRFAQA